MGRASRVVHITQEIIDRVAALLLEGKTHREIEAAGICSRAMVGRIFRGEQRPFSYSRFSRRDPLNHRKPTDVAFCEACGVMVTMPCVRCACREAKVATPVDSTPATPDALNKEVVHGSAEFEAGRQAFRDGLSDDECPYRESYDEIGRGNGFPRYAWMRGFFWERMSAKERGSYVEERKRRCGGGHGGQAGGSARHANSQLDRAG